MTDIVERLRFQEKLETVEDVHELFADAESEIQRLRAKQEQMALEYLTAEGQWIEETGRLRAALMAAGTEDAPFTVPNHSFSTMSPKDCYEAGAMDGAMAVREAVKNAARAALEEKE